MLPPVCPRRLRWFVAIVATLLLAGTLGCKQRPEKVPGETDVEVKQVLIVAKGADTLELPHAVLFERLGQRPGSLILLARTWSPFREAEDRRRVEAFWQQHGYFEVEVRGPSVDFDKQDGAATIKYEVVENERYSVGTVRMEHAPAEEKAPLEALLAIPQGETDIDLERFRKVRVEMQEHLRRRGYGHANVYSRSYVDKEKRLLHVYMFVDAGPKTKIASVKIDGNVKVPAADIERRSGLQIGAPYSEDLRDRVVRDLLDTGAFAAAYVRVDTDTKFIVPGTAPDTGGELRDEQIDADGNLVPRKLPEGVNVIVHVVEAPSQSVRLRAGFEVDPARADTAIAGDVQLRNLFGPTHHLVLEGRIGYGWIFDQGSDERPGLYGEALIRTVHPGVLGRTGDVRTTARYVGTLFPSAFLHRWTTGVGARTTFLKGLFLDVDLLAFVEKTEGFGPFFDDERERHALQSRDVAAGPEIDSSFVWDGRDDPVEPMRGGFVSISSRINPLDLDGIADYPFINVAPEGRVFIPLGPSLSIGLRAYGEWSLLATGDGVPLGERLFGGGNYGFRGHGAQRLSPVVLRCFQDFCKEVPVGGRSLVESSIELRFLPPQKPYGAVVFGDLGGASGDLNPFAGAPQGTGVSLAAGVGARLRLWYLPAAIDLAYRILSDAQVQAINDAPFHVFFRIGEAF